MSDAVVNGLAGAGGGIIAQLLTYPLQAVNTRQQTERKLKRKPAASKQSQQLAMIDAGRQNSKGTAQEMLEILKSEGWGGLYRGLKPSLVGTACSQGVYYYFYQLLRDRAQSFAIQRKLLGYGDGSVGMFSSLLVAAIAGCANVLLTNPIWVTVTRMQTQSQVHNLRPPGLQLEANLSSGGPPAAHTERTNLFPKASSQPAKMKVLPKSELDVSVDMANALATTDATAHGSIKPPLNMTTFGTIRDLYSEAGILGFWKGVLPTLVMVSNPAIQFALYETMLASVLARRAVTKGAGLAASATEVFIMGAVAKLGATVVTYPLLVVKSRLQAKQNIGFDSSSQYSGTLDAIVKMMKHEGVAGFYKGMSTKIVQSVFAAAVLFMTKEELVKLARILVARKTLLATTLHLKTV